jgi:hypothetical protein
MYYEEVMSFPLSSFPLSVMALLGFGGMYNTVRTAAKRRKEEGKIKIKNKSSF